MSIFIRKKLSVNFTHLPNSLIRDPNLSWKATGFLAYLLSCADGWQLNFADLSKRKKDGEAATRAAAGELKEAGYLQINKIRDSKGRINAHEWVVSQQPEFQNPDVDSPDVEIPHLENRGQRKNNSKSNSSNKQQPQQQHKPATQGGGCGVEFFFDKAIAPELHVQLGELLGSVEPKLAQQMLDTLAQKIIWGDQDPEMEVGSPLGLIKHFINVDFDPSPGFKIAAERKKKEENKLRQRNAETVVQKQREELKHKNLLALDWFEQLHEKEKSNLQQRFSDWLAEENKMVFQEFKAKGLQSKAAEERWLNFLRGKSVD